MKESHLLETLSNLQVVLEDGHFVYNSGNHGSVYVNKDLLYPHTKVTDEICKEIAQRFSSEKVEVVVGPAMGGILLAQGVAHHLSQITGNEILAIYAEKDTVAIPDPEGKDRKCHAETGKFAIKRGNGGFVFCKRVLIVEDILTTGKTALEVVRAVEKVGGEVVGIGAICNRGGVTRYDIGKVPLLDSILNLKFEMFSEEECARHGPCSKGVPINLEFGKGKEYLARKRSKGSK